MLDKQVLLNDRYQLEDEIGAGGMAVVYRAQDLLLERPVAIKLLKRSFSRDQAFRERFRQEAKAAANLSHPNIVTVYDFGLDSERLYIVMEYLAGKNLKSIIQRQGVLDVDLGIQLLIQACAGVGYAHRAGLVHCDIKAHNMIVTPDNRLKVTDFGIARALASIHPDEKTNYVWGSPQYFSPEQAGGAAPSPASDVYSLGVVLYETITGQLPFTEESLDALTRLHRESLPVSPRAINPAIPISLEQILVKVLSKEPAARYRTADQFGRVLITLSQTLPSQPARIVKLEEKAASAVPPVEPRSKPNKQAASELNFLDIDWVAILLGLIALIAVGGLIPFWLWVYFAFNPPLR
jgi:serine/threonine-protein kinase